jgi:hypothetical protein
VIGLLPAALAAAGNHDAGRFRPGALAGHAKWREKRQAGWREMSMT